MNNDIFHRTQRLLGAEATDTLKNKRVIIFGVGGVGSWCAECLVRTGIHHLTIVDSDNVAPSNINRQLMATTETIGQSKVSVLAERLKSINPEAQVNALQELYSAETSDSFHLEQYDYIIDAIDSLEDKAQLILHACQTQAKLYSSMGAALKLDATKIEVAEFWKTHGCPLAKALRNRFKRKKEYPAKKFKCIFSPEVLENKGEEDLSELSFNKVKVNGSLCHITAIFGMQLAGLVIQDIVSSQVSE